MSLPETFHDCVLWINITTHEAFRLATCLFDSHFANDNKVAAYKHYIRREKLAVNIDSFSAKYLT